MSKQVTPQHALCIDFETSGSIFGGDSSKDHQGISFGAIIFTTHNFEPVEKLHRYVQFDPIRYKWSMEAQRIHGITQEHLAQHGVSQEQAALDLVELITKYCGTGKVMFLGHNARFDIAFTNQLLSSIQFELTDMPLISRELRPDNTLIELHHVVLDTSSLGFITLGLFKSDLLFERIGFEKRGAHNALADAEMTLATCKAIRLLVELSLE